MRDSLALAALVAVLSLAALDGARAAESRSGARLLGTIVSSDPRSSQAVISVGGSQQVVRIGMDVAGAEVVEIQPEAVVLRRRGQNETLTLASVSVGAVGGGGSLPAAPAPAAYGPNPPASAPGGRPGAGIPSTPSARAASGASARRGAASAPGSKPSERDQARSNDQVLADLAAQARFAPVMDNDGKLRGVAVMNIMPDSMIERLGLQSDDVVVAIQGTPIDSSGRAMNVARGLTFSQPVKLDIERHGMPTVVIVQPGSLQRP